MCNDTLLYIDWKDEVVSVSHLTAGVLYGRGCCVVEGKEEATLITISHVAAQSACFGSFARQIQSVSLTLCTEFLTVSPAAIGTRYGFKAPGCCVQLSSLDVTEAQAGSLALSLLRTNLPA